MLALEPARSSFAALVQNVALNDMRNVHAIRMAPSDRASSAVLYHNPDRSRNALAATHAEVGQETVETAMLDDLLEREGIDKVRLIKVDVEGAEELAFRGAELTLRQRRPVVVFEINAGGAAALGLSAIRAWRFLDGPGYAFYAVDEGGSRLRRLQFPKRSGNVVAPPAESA